jgi:hypothetical protein
VGGKGGGGGGKEMTQALYAHMNKKYIYKAGTEKKNRLNLNDNLMRPNKKMLSKVYLWPSANVEF